MLRKIATASFNLAIGLSFGEIKEAMLFKETSFENEVRYLNIGKIFDKFYTVVITYRNDKIRIVSARRSRKKEIEIYDSRRVW